MTSPSKFQEPGSTMEARSVMHPAMACVGFSSWTGIAARISQSNNWGLPIMLKYHQGLLVECGCYHKQDDASELHRAFTTAEILLYLDGNLIWIDTKRKCSMISLGKIESGFMESVNESMGHAPNGCMGLTQTSWPMYTIPRSIDNMEWTLKWRHRDSADASLLSRWFSHHSALVSILVGRLVA